MTGFQVVKTLEDQLKTLVEHLQHQGAAAASSPAPVSLTQAEEEEPVDEPAAVGQGHAWDSPRGSPVDGAGAAFSPQPEDLLDREEPGMMLEGEEGYDGDEVQFVSETGPG